MCGQNTTCGHLHCGVATLCSSNRTYLQLSLFRFPFLSNRLEEIHSSNSSHFLLLHIITKFLENFQQRTDNLPKVLDFYKRQKTINVLYKSIRAIDLITDNLIRGRVLVGTNLINDKGRSSLWFSYSTVPIDLGLRYVTVPNNLT